MEGDFYMPKKELIDKYYVPETDDIRMDKEMKSIFWKIAELRKQRKS